MPLIWDRQCHLWRGGDQREVTQQRKSKRTRVETINALPTNTPHTAKMHPPLLDNGKGKQNIVIDTSVCPKEGAPARDWATSTHQCMECIPSPITNISNSQNEQLMGVQCMTKSCNDDSTNDSKTRVRGPLPSERTLGPSLDVRIISPC